MNKINLLFFIFTLVSCSNVKKEDINKLDGYWEIREVEMPDGQEKEYKVNETIDYFELEERPQSLVVLNGFRQKVMPQFDGTFKTNGIREIIKVLDEGDRFFIEFSTKYGKWKEEIIALEDSTLVLKNKDDLMYKYKKFKPFKLE
ncbi:hypothetical protein [Flavobacterium sp.]